MCMFKSGIILKDKVFIPDYDSHTDMLNELGIEDTEENARTLFIRAEFIPPNHDVFSNIDTWQFRIDQDITPSWYVSEYDKTRMIEAVKKWAKTHIYVGVDGLELLSGSGYYLKDCKNVILKNNVHVEEVCNTRINLITGNSRIGIIGGNSSVGEMWGNSSIGVMRENSSVGEMWGHSRATISYDHSEELKAESIKLHDNATIKDYRTNTIYQAGKWKIVSTNN